MSNHTVNASARFLALGDSYTIGEGVASDQCWPAQLTRRLRARGIEIAEPEIVAATGWTTDDLSAAMDEHRFAVPYALVSLLIGVNNQYQDRALEAYRADFAALLSRALQLAGGHASRMLIVSIPDWGVTRFAREKGRAPDQIATRIDAFNHAARTIASDGAVAFIDVTAISREAASGEAMLTGDGLHPSAAQYAIWTDAILPAARRALAADPSD